MVRNRFAICFLVTAFALTLQARVISYAPYTDRTAYPAHQSRMNRHFALFEAAPYSQSNPQPPTFGQLVVYDFEGIDEPHVVFPADGSSVVFTTAALRESEVGTLQIFVQAQRPGQSLFDSWLSVDGGATWKSVALPPTSIAQLATTGSDNGGPFASYRYSQIRVGNAQYPFVVAFGEGVFAVGADASARTLYAQSSSNPPQIALAGRNGDGTQFLLRTNTQLVTIDLSGAMTPVLTAFSSQLPSFEGFIASDGAVYVDERSNYNAGGTLWYVHNGAKKALFPVLWTDATAPSAFMIPTADYSGAWIITRGGGHPTALYRDLQGDSQKMFEDITAPDVEALHTGSSGDKLLIQVHRPRPVDVRMFRDPALAVWHVGQPAPRAYDELFLNEEWNKGFVHVDVEKIEGGEPFVFDSGTSLYGGGGGGIIVSPPPAGGGGDVVQEWGVVRASLRQQLVFPAVGRTHGAFGSDWVSDVIIQNPLDAPQRIDLKFVSSGGLFPVKAVSLTLNPLEIRMIHDIVGSLLEMDGVIGALFVTPEAGVTATSRTYSRSGNGTFGFGMNAVDVFAAAASPRFPVTFAGAFPGSNYRTNMTLTDTSGRGTEAILTADGPQGAMGADGISFSTAANGHEQMNFIGTSLGLMPYETGALRVTPTRGNALTAVFTIDNRTNDSTYFAPDVPASFTRMIPAIGHLDGANGAKFRSDVYLFNPSDQPRAVTLEAKSWEIAESPAFLTLTLLPNEARVIRDALVTAFGKTGIARLRYTSQTPGGSGVRVTSRTYNVDSNGGTYGFLMPPLNNFQIAGSGDSLEILGAVADPGYRTNIGLVDMTEWPTNQNATARVEILDSSSKTVDSFNVTFPVAGGTQLNDVFRARELSVSGPVLIRITPASGMIGAYATTTDNITNDSSYLAANLSAKQ